MRTLIRLNFSFRSQRCISGPWLMVSSHVFLVVFLFCSLFVMRYAYIFLLQDAIQPLKGNTRIDTREGREKLAGLNISTRSCSVFFHTSLFPGENAVQTLPGGLVVHFGSSSFVFKRCHSTLPSPLFARSERWS